MEKLEIPYSIYIFSIELIKKIYIKIHKDLIDGFRRSLMKKTDTKMKKKGASLVLLH